MKSFSLCLCSGKNGTVLIRFFENCIEFLNKTLSHGANKFIKHISILFMAEGETLFLAFLLLTLLTKKALDFESGESKSKFGE